MTITAFKLYEPTTATANFYCAVCNQLITAGDSCTNVTHPPESEDEEEYPTVTTICDECLYEDAE